MTIEGTHADLSREEFVRNLDDSGLSGVEDLGAALGPLNPSSNGGEVAQQLVDAGKLTAYQAEAVLGRRFGELRLGNYDLLERIGAGGMGTVFKARHRRMKRVVALKVLSREVARSETFAQRFQREVETIARLIHPNIVLAFDADEAEAGPFLVMEFVDGRDLASEVLAHGPLSAADAVECLLQAARGLEYAHGQGIIHRDIKPGNILRDATGLIKVADLGLARLTAGSAAPAENTALTQAGGIVGTLDFMAPEQALDSTAVDQRVDVYSLGCTLHFLLTGRPPYSAGSVMALLLKHREAPIPSLCDARPDASPDLDALFRRMVAKNPDDRGAGMAEVVRALEGLKRLGRLASVRPSVAAAGGSDAGGLTAAIGAADATAVRGAGPAPQPTPALAERVAGRTVVVVEPSRTQAGIIRRYLQQLGVGTVHATGSGREALELAKRERADALICSMHLADMTGVQLAAALAADPECAAVGFVLATSEAETETAATLPRDPRTVVMAKPFDVQRLAEAFSQATVLVRQEFSAREKNAVATAVPIPHPPRCEL